MMIRKGVKTVVALALLGAVAVLVVNAFPALVGADYSFVVMSGSMEPTIPVGSVVFVQDVSAADIDEGDVITFSKGTRTVPTTHRAIEVYRSDVGVRFVTKGDANEDRDPEPVYRSDLVGKVTLKIPYVGYLSAFASSRAGWFVMIVLPCSLLVLSEMWELWKAGTRNEEHT